MKKILGLVLIASLFANANRPGLSTWFSASELSHAGGGKLLIMPTSRNVNMITSVKNHSFSTSFIFYPAGIQAQSASLIYPKNNKIIITSINHISYGAFNGYDENAQQTENYTASDTWIKLGYSKVSKSLPLSFGISNQIYISKLENYNSTSLYSSFGIIWNLDKYNLDIGGRVKDLLLIHKSTDIRASDNSLEIEMGFCKKLTYLPLKLSIDCIISNDLRTEDYFISGVFTISKNIYLTAGTSTRKYSQNTEQNLTRTIFGSSGIGVNYKNKDLTIGYGLYFYGTGGFSNGLDLTINF
ncbi:hypothetical protein N9E35_00710 [Candidatus Marinimicrobia bacterium]|nr:hypothetical protein [Candidatus Neomarinimicrobiota bacterium]